MTYMANAYKGTKCDIVTEQLKDMIISGTYKSGEKLPNEASLCEMFGVSRITIREAMKKLSMMGLLDIRQGKGTFVKSMDLSLFMKPLYQLIDFEEVDIDAIFDARLYIESGTVYLAATRRTEADLERMERNLQELKKAIALEDLNTVSHYDSAIHEEIAKCAGNPILLACLQAVNEINKTCVLRLSKSMEMLDDCFDEHYKIYEGIKNQNADAAVEALRRHTMNSKMLLL